MADKYTAFEINGAEEFREAIRRNPQTILDLVGKFIIRGLAEYKRIIIRSPWRMGMAGGGAPVATGNLRDTHLTETTSFDGRIYPTASYSEAVHKTRPWLDYATTTADPAVEKLEQELLSDIVADLAK
jgi:hypothetical protein